MKPLLKLIPLFGLLLIISSCSDQLTDTYNSDAYNVSKDLAMTPGDLSPEEAAGLIYMRQEEKVARDVYTVLGQMWNLNIFEIIVPAEQKHMDAIKRLLVKYDIEDPAINDEIGVFSEPLFEQMYNDFVIQGQQSIPEAMLAGQAIEEQDIADLESQLTIADNQDIIKVYMNLKSASEKHLSSFTIHITPNF